MRPPHRIGFLPKLQDVFFIALFSAVLLLGNRMLNLDGDLPRHILTGKLIAETREFPHTEPFIYPYQGRDYISHEWLADFLFYQIYKFSGLAGIVVLSAGLLASSFYLLLRSAAERTNIRFFNFLLVGGSAVVTSLNWAARPHVISMFLLTVWLIEADKLRRNEPVALWQFPALLAVWSNLHGEFIAGILALLSFAAGWAIDFIFKRENAAPAAGKKLGIVLLLSAGASLLNPAGIGPWKSLLGFVNNPYLMSRMLEANSPNFQNPELRMLLLFIAFSIFLLAFKREALPAGQGILLAGFSAMTLIAFRNVHLYGVAAPFVLAETLNDLRQIRFVNRIETNLQRIEENIRGNAWPALAAVLLSLLVLTSKPASAFYGFTEPQFPVRAVQWLESHPQTGNMFNELDWGGYIALHQWPDQLTFIDSMADVTGEVTLQYEQVITLAPGWEKIFDQYNVEWAIIRQDNPLARALRQKNWQEIYRDDAVVILRR